MPRTGRVVLPGYPHHILHIGHSHQRVFLRSDDFRRYREDLFELKHEFNVGLVAYCLLDARVHLIVTPPSATALGQLMKGLAARATRARNRSASRCGTLWEGRYRSSVIDPERYLLACMRYVEQLPADVAPHAYPWSSCRARIGLDASQSLDPAPGFAALGAGVDERRRRYADLLAQPLPADQARLIHDAVRRNQLTGAAGFADAVARLVGRRIECRGPGRPPLRAGERAASSLSACGRSGVG